MTSSSELLLVLTVFLGFIEVGKVLLTILLWVVCTSTLTLMVVVTYNKRFADHLFRRR